MKLFFKHLFKSIKNRPLQPFILIFTIMLSVLVCASTLLVGNFINKENDAQQLFYYGKADFTVSLSSTSASRFSFAEDAQEILDGKAIVTGVYEFPLFMLDSGTNVFCSATDFFSINNIFSYEFYEYLPLTQNAVSDCAFVSSDFAKKFGIELGQTFTAKVLGYQKNYTVHGISQTPFLSGCDVLVDITSVMRLLATDSLFVGALGDDFKPCTTIFGATQNGYSPQECIELLQADEQFKDKTFAVVKDSVKVLSSIEALNFTVYFIIGLSLALCVVVTFCCFYIISKERALENILFYTIGAKPFYLNAIQFAEVFIYWLIGTPLGLCLSLPLASVIYSSIGFKFTKFALQPLPFIISAGVILLISLLSALAFIISSQKTKSVKKTSMQVVYVLGIGALIALTLTFLMNVSLKFACACAFIALLFFFVFFSVPQAVKLLARKIASGLTKKLKNGKRVRASFLYAFKNVEKIDVLQNSCRLLTIIISIILTVSVCIMGGTHNLQLYRNQLSGDFIIYNATKQCEQKLQAVSEIENVYSLYIGTTNKDGFPLISTSSVDAVSEEARLTTLPKNDEAFISFGLSKKTNLSTGDKYSFNIGEKAITVTIKGVLNSCINALFFDSEYFGIPFNLLTVQGFDGVDKQVLHSAVSGALALEMTTIVSTSEFIEKKIQASELYLNAACFLAPLMILFAFIGFFDNLLESYRARKQEFALYQTAGMTAKEIRLMKVTELLFTFACATFMALICSLLSVITLNQGFFTFSYTLLLNFV